MNQDTENKIVIGIDQGAKGKDQTVITVLKLTPSQKWLVLKSFIHFTKDESIKIFLEEFPDCDVEALKSDLESILNQVDPC